MPVQGDRSLAICRECQSALAVRILADGSIRPIGTGTTCSCGGDAFDVVGERADVETGGTDDGIATDADDGRPQPRA
ncbi:hypothetical protein [Natronolimnohabitans innermongolicus]|uniref:Uncharacterized protein n=1 Tax=Natronolimnohabitans innermongolicus JCM 12255 TaxID=1227499 RepID=L9X7Z6_9EURY|nr:hypothetical protein [Natronolimnohabitans innermongolicus]ELY57521.1 hypothetical protein C493_08546 [Natronolimnohabitans innermongolicus JCM 12255]